MRALLLAALPACGFNPAGRTSEALLAPPVGECADAATDLDAPSITATADDLVFRASWETNGTGETWVLMRRSDGWVESTPADGSGRTDHETPLLGLRADETYEAQVAWRVGQDLHCSEIVEFETDPLPADLPEIFLGEEAGEAPAPGYSVMSVITEQAYWAVIVDGEGEYVWAKKVEELGERVRYDPLKQAVITNIHAEATDKPGGVEFHTLGVAASSARLVDGAHTDFVFLPDGTYATLGWDMRSFGEGEDERKLLGDTIVEVSPDGTSEIVWNAWEFFVIDLGRTYITGFYSDPDVEDWTHANGLSYEPATDSYLISISGLQAVASVSRQTGETRWVLSSDERYTMFEHGQDDPLIEDPHSIVPTGPDQYLVFNRRSINEQTDCSQAKEFRLDLDAMTADPVWTYEGEECHEVTFLGSAERLGSGNTLISWSTSGLLEEVTPAGELAWQVGTHIGAAFGFAEHADSLY